MQIAENYDTGQVLYPVAPYRPPTPMQPVAPGGVIVTTGVDGGGTGPTPVAPAYNPGGGVTYFPGPGEIITGYGGGGGLQVPLGGATPPPAPPGNGSLPNQTYNCGGRCGGTPLPSPGAAGATSTVTAAGGSMLAGVPWWVWLLIAVLVVLVLAKK